MPEFFNQNLRSVHVRNVSSRIEDLQSIESSVTSG